MNREQFIQYISDEYGVDEEYLFAKHPLFCVFRHSSNRKWFAVVMDVPKNKLGLEGADALDVVNLKCGPHPHRLAAERTRHLPGLPHEQSELGLSRLRRQCAGRTDKNVAGYEL